MSDWSRFIPQVSSGLSRMGRSAEAGQMGQIEQFARYLAEQNRWMNLTAITEPEQMAVFHFLDSAALLGATDFAGKRVVDVGTGAGFPGLPLKLLEPSLSLVLLDGQRKRVEFLRRSVQILGLSGVLCLQARAEEQSRLSGFRDAFDLAVSRAVADLRVLAELCLPFVRVGGRFLAMKSTESQEELEAAGRAIALLGGRLLPPYVYTLPGGIARTVILVEKDSPTPEAYPRRFVKMKKAPL